MTELRVLTYNIHLGGRNAPAVAEVVRAVAPDVLVVNESPKCLLTWRRRCLRLAERWGMRYVAGGRPAGSNLLLASDRVAVRWARSRVLRQPLFQPRRGIVWAQLRVDGRLFGVVGTHLGLEPERRAEEVAAVLAAASEPRGPVVVAGDLNEPPSGPSWRALRGAGFADRGSAAWPTFPADGGPEPARRIDALLVRGPARVLSHGDPGVPVELLRVASDHRPVLAVLEI